MVDFEARSYLKLNDGRAFPLPNTVAEATAVVDDARARGEEMVTFRLPNGAANVQLTDTVERVVDPAEVAHMSEPWLGR